MDMCCTSSQGLTRRTALSVSLLPSKIMTQLGWQSWFSRDMLGQTKTKQTSSTTLQHNSPAQSQWILNQASMRIKIGTKVLGESLVALDKHLLDYKSKGHCTLPPKLSSVIKQIRSGSIFCVFPSVACILIGKDDEYKKTEKRMWKFWTPCTRTLSVFILLDHYFLSMWNRELCQWFVN